MFFPDFSSGQTTVREMVQSKLPLSMLRLSTPVETETTLVMAGHEHAIGLLGRYLNLRGISQERSLLLVGLSGYGRIVSAARKEAIAIAKQNGGILVGKQFGDQWRKSRFRSPYLRNTLWEKGFAVDTLETAVPWHRVEETLEAIENAIRDAIVPAGERVHV
ncbi:MAG: FAD-linked oxidase C-terminal domain-containing protein, partial [Chloroflexota bacterium]